MRMEIMDLLRPFALALGVYLAFTIRNRKKKD